MGIGPTEAQGDGGDFNNRGRWASSWVSKRPINMHEAVGTFDHRARRGGDATRRKIVWELKYRSGVNVATTGPRRTTENRNVLGVDGQHPRCIVQQDAEEFAHLRGDKPSEPLRLSALSPTRTMRSPMPMVCAGSSTGAEAGEEEPDVRERAQEAVAAAVIAAQAASKLAHRASRACD